MRVDAGQNTWNSHSEEVFGEDLAVSILRGDWLYFPSLGWRAETIVGLGFREGLNVVQDMALVLDVAAHGGSLYYDEAVAFMYRRHKASDSSWRALEGTASDVPRLPHAGLICAMNSTRTRQTGRPDRGEIPGE